jgi:hypothetical protein
MLASLSSTMSRFVALVFVHYPGLLLGSSSAGSTFGESKIKCLHQITASLFNAGNEFI